MYNNALKYVKIYIWAAYWLNLFICIMRTTKRQLSRCIYVARSAPFVIRNLLMTFCELYRTWECRFDSNPVEQLQRQVFSWQRKEWFATYFEISKQIQSYVIRFVIPQWSYVFGQTCLDKQCRLRSDCSSQIRLIRVIPSTLFELITHWQINRHSY